MINSGTGVGLNYNTCVGEDRIGVFREVHTFMHSYID